MIQTFAGQTQAEAEAKADVWIETQTGLKNVRKQSYVFRSAFAKVGPKNDGDWTVAVHYEQES